jgi:hypothetical protein
MKTVGAILLTVVLLGVAGSSLAFYAEEGQRSAQVEAYATRGFASPPAPQVGGSGAPSTPPLPGTAGAPARPMTPAVPSASPHREKPVDSKELLQEVRDEVEVLEAQLEVKRALVQAATVASEAAAERFSLMEELRKKGVGAVTGENYSNARFTLTKAKAEVAIRVAEMREPALRLAQARRRLADLEKAATPSSNHTQLCERLIGLEKKLDELRKEIQDLRKQLGAAKERR